MPEGHLARSPEECRQIAERLGGPVVIKAQVWRTGRAQAGLVQFADTPQQAAEASQRIFDSTVTGHRVDAVLVERRVAVEREFYAGLFVDDRSRKPVLLLSSKGGTGIEDRALTRPETVVTLPVSVTLEPSFHELESAIAGWDAFGESQAALADVLLRIYQTARRHEARTVEINPLALTTDGKLTALDCRISIDDYAVFRHPELGIEVGREFSHPPTELEKIAWQIEKDDYRGTFYFVELLRDREGTGVSIGFHGAGGGGAMASLDAAAQADLRPLNYSDTSGNPPASKVYRAARIILSQPGIQGYFLSGSGVASQEQFHLARALVKAFREERLSIPAVLRLGGNGEELAARVIQAYAAESQTPVEVYQSKHTADYCAGRLADLINLGNRSIGVPFKPAPGDTLTSPREPYVFETRSGRITYDHTVCVHCESKACVEECPPKILSLAGELPVLNISREDAKRGRCIECLACEVECWFQGKGGASIDLPIPGLEEYRERHRGPAASTPHSTGS